MLPTKHSLYFFGELNKSRKQSERKELENEVSKAKIEQRSFCQQFENEKNKTSLLERENQRLLEEIQLMGERINAVKKAANKIKAQARHMKNVKKEYNRKGRKLEEQIQQVVDLYKAMRLAKDNITATNYKIVDELKQELCKAKDIHKVSKATQTSPLKEKNAFRRFWKSESRGKTNKISTKKRND